MSAILLPMKTSTEPDWTGFARHTDRTLSAGLVPAINMDTGYANLLSDLQRQCALDLARDCCAGKPFLGGVFVRDEPAAPFDFDAYRRGIDQVQANGGTPIIFQSYGLTGQSDDDILESYRRIGEHAGKFLAFELGKMFAPFGKIYSLPVYEGLLSISSCIGAKHSSLSRAQEWQRIRLRDALRPEFKVLTGNDLAIDMVRYGSDYLLGLSTFAPEAFALRDAMWKQGDPTFYELNDVLQYLGCFAFRNPVPAYKHNAAQFLHRLKWIETPLTFPNSPARPDSDIPILQNILTRLNQFS
ncbi:MAG: dihydrodipicolinate synthase family protein [Limisphaerales bacterium]